MEAAIRNTLYDEATGEIGLPNRKRYNRFVFIAMENSKIGGDPGRATVYATLALAEATLLAGEAVA